jgi:micrococcal nuclease
MTRPPRTIGRAATAAGLLILLSTLEITACTPARPELPTSAIVGHVIDGDTIELADGIRVRLLAIDAPELRKPSNWGADQCGAREAAHGLAERLPHGAPVVLLRDTGEPDIDRYQRQLRYVLAHLGGSDWRDVGLDLTEAGLVVVYEQYPTSRAPEYRAAQERAKAAQLGLWRPSSSGGCSAG